MQIHWNKRIKAALLALAVAAAPLAGCAAEAPTEQVPMGRYVEQRWALPEGAPMNYVSAVHQRPDGRIALITSDENGRRYFSTADGTDWREDFPAWLEGMKEYASVVESISFNSKGEGAIGYWGAVPGSEEQRYRVALIRGDELIHTPIGDDGDPWRDDSVRSYTITSGSGEDGEAEAETTAGAEVEGDTEATGNAAVVQDLPKAEAESSGTDGSESTDGEEGDEGVYVGSLYLERVIMGEDGHVYVKSWGNSGRFDPETGELLASYDYEAAAVAVAGDRFVQLLTEAAAERSGVAVESNTMLFSGLESGNVERTLPAANLRLYNTTMAGKADGSVLITDSTGLYRIAGGGDTWEKIIDGNLCSLSMPSMSVYELIPHGENEFLIFYSGDENVIMNYVYSSDTPTLPDTELTIYSIVQNKTVSQAVGVFRQSHPGVLVNIRTLQEEEGSGTGDDARRTLNTELLAGKGPDLFLLADLPIESYIEKGVLADISDVVRPLTDSNAILPAIATTYARDGKIYAVPTRFTVPTIWGDKEAIAAAKSLETLVKYVESYPNARLLGDMRAEHVLAQFATSAWSSFVDEDGTVNTEALADYFELVKRMLDTADNAHVYSIFEDEENQQKPNFTVELEEESQPYPEDFFAVANNRALIMSAHLDGFQSILLPNGVLYKRGGGKTFDETGEGDWASDMPLEDVDKIFRLMPSAQGGVYNPTCVVGVNAAGKQQDLAKEFVAAMLSEATQTADLEDGFPINRKAITSAVENEEGWYFSRGYNSDEEYADELMLEYAWPSKEMLRAVTGTFDSLDTPLSGNYSLFMKYTVQEMIANAFQSYYDGDVTAAEAAQSVAAETKLVQAEGQ